MTRRPLIGRLLQWRLPAEDRDEILGDLDEQFLECVSDQGERRARAWYRRQALDIHQAFLSLGCALICWQSLRRTWRTA